MSTSLEDLAKLIGQLVIETKTIKKELAQLTVQVAQTEERLLWALADNKSETQAGAIATMHTVQDHHHDDAATSSS